MGHEILSKSKAKEFKSLSSKKERDNRGLFLAEGDKCVADMVGFFEVENLVCTYDWSRNHTEICAKYQDKLLITDKRGIEIISSMNSLPDVIGVFKKPENEEKVPKLDCKKLYILLDEIQDPGNMGTIIRTCDWFGIYEIFASKKSVDVFNPKVIQSTMGSLSRVKVKYLDLYELIIENDDMPLIGTLMKGIPLNEYVLKNGLLLMGNEGRGISEKLKQRLNVALTIPPYNLTSHPDSLNVAIATAIILSRYRM